MGAAPCGIWASRPSFHVRLLSKCRPGQWLHDGVWWVPFRLLSLIFEVSYVDERVMRHDHLRESATVNSVFALVDLVIRGSLIPFSRLFLRLGGILSHGKRSVLSTGSGVANGLSCALPVGDIWVQLADGQCVAHCSVGRSDVKLSVLCSRTPATLCTSESEICAATQ